MEWSRSGNGVGVGSLIMMMQCRLARMADGVTILLNDAFKLAQPALAKNYEYSSRDDGEDSGFEVMSNT